MIEVIKNKFYFILYFIEDRKNYFIYNFYLILYILLHL